MAKKTAVVRRSRRRAISQRLTRAKARKILSDKEVRGKALTTKQRKFFGFVAGKGKS